MENNMNQELITAVEAIKTAILQSQYQAAKETTRVQLILYYGIGRYLSSKKGKKTWGTSVLETISSQLRKELPGLRGFSATSLKKMRLFYENWNFLEDSNSSVMTDELPEKLNSSDASDELTSIIPIADFKLTGINLADFPVEDFFKVPFSHHITIFSKIKNLQERYYYIHRVVEENLQVDTLEILIKKDAYKHQKELPNNFERTITPAYLRIVDDKIKKPHENRTIGIVLCKSMNKQFAEYVIQDYDKPMGVTTYKSLSEMPEEMQKVLPDLDDIKKIM